MRRKARTKLVLVIAALVGPASAEPFAVLNPSIVLSERLSETVKVSGAFVTGAAFAGATPLENRPSLRTRVPEAWAGQAVCVHVRSRDGTYEAKYEYQIPGAWSEGGVADLRYDTAYPDLFAQDAAENAPTIAIAITPGDCNTKSNAMLVAYWNAEDARERLPVELYVNSVGADDVFVYAGDDPSAAAIECERIMHRALAFDFVCALPAAVLSKAVTPIEINATRSGVYDPVRTVEIVLPVSG